METVTEALRNINPHWGVLVGMKRQVIEESVQFDTALWELDYPVKKVDYLDIRKHIAKECPCCNNNYIHMKKIFMLPCEHSMHIECFPDFWRNSDNRSCPLCRAAISWPPRPNLHN